MTVFVGKIPTNHGHIKNLCAENKTNMYQQTLLMEENLDQKPEYSSAASPSLVTKIRSGADEVSR